MSESEPASDICAELFHYHECLRVNAVAHIHQMLLGKVMRVGHLIRRFHSLTAPPCVFAFHALRSPFPAFNRPNGYAISTRRAMLVFFGNAVRVFDFTRDYVPALQLNADTICFIASAHKTRRRTPRREPGAIPPLSVRERAVRETSLDVSLVLR